MNTVDLLEDWMAAPTVEGAARLRAAIRLEPEYNPYRDISAHCDREYRAGRVAALREMLLSLMPSQALSPSAHGMLARCHEALGDDAAAAAERRLMVLSAQAILRSGDGSADRPWTVLRTSDEYDVLEVLGMQYESQASRRTPTSTIDTFTDHAGEAVHFELHDAPKGRTHG